MMVFAGCACPGSTVISGETPVCWGSAVWHVSSVMVCAQASVAWCAVAWGSVKGSRVTSVRFTVTVTPISRIMGVRSRSAEPVPILMVTVVMPIAIVTPRCGSITSSSVVVSVLCWYVWGQNFVREIHCDMAIIITVKTSYVGAIACHVASFLALKTFIIITGHDVYWWWWS